MAAKWAIHLRTVLMQAHRRSRLLRGDLAFDQPRQELSTLRPKFLEDALMDGSDSRLGISLQAASGFWVKVVGRYFSALERYPPLRASFFSDCDLQAAIRSDIADCNTRVQPFCWTKPTVRMVNVSGLYP